ncbi:MAG: diguanylate cyclase, partial [Moraxellaceae bacterium]|nr:diguanylate cyclase [Moraxellaceae bacterium]
AVDVTMLVSTSLGMIAFQDPYNVRLSMAIVVVCFSIVFATGMQRLLPCMLIALATFLITMVISHRLGLQAGFWSFAMQFAVVVAGMILLCHFMMRAHRVDFLQSELLLHDKQRLLELSAELAELSERDSLTGLANRRRFDALLVSEWERAMRQPLPLAVLFVDVDFFKSYNDHKGHQAGDACLAAVAKILEESLRRPADLVARYGGEEFIVLLPDTEPDGALELAMFILERLRKCAMPHETSPFKIVTASIGLAAMPPLGRSGPSGLLAAADKALYAAKAAGRNRIEVAVPDAATGELRLSV